MTDVIVDLKYRKKNGNLLHFSRVLEVPSVPPIGSVINFGCWLVPVTCVTYNVNSKSFSIRIEDLGWCSPEEQTIEGGGLDPDPDGEEDDMELIKEAGFSLAEEGE